MFYSPTLYSPACSWSCSIFQWGTVNPGPSGGQRAAQAPGIENSEVRVRRGLTGLHILSLLSWAIFKSLRFEQEAIVKVFLGKVAFSEKNYSPPLGKIRGALPGHMAENRAEIVSCRLRLRHCQPLAVAQVTP